MRLLSYLKMSGVIRLKTNKIVDLLDLIDRKNTNLLLEMIDGTLFMSLIEHREPDPKSEFALEPESAEFVFTNDEEGRQKVQQLIKGLNEWLEHNKTD